MSAIKDYLDKKKKKNPNLRIGSLKQISESQYHPPLTSGNVVFDYITSIGGIPRGVVTEIRGKNASGKSTIAAMAAAEHQKAVRAGKATGAILYLDFEYAVSGEYFKALGLDVDDEETFVYYQPDTLEEGFNMFLEMTKEGLLAMGVIDSVAGASSAAEYEAEVGKASVGLKARGFHQGLRMSIGPMKVTGTSLILINHTQVKIPQTFMEKQMASRGIQDVTSPGGTAIEYYSSMRIDLARPQLIKSEAHDELLNDKSKQVTSIDVEAYTFKNKVGIPHRKGKMRIELGKGFDSVYSAFHILVDYKILSKKSGGHFSFPEELIPKGLDKLPVGEDNVIQAIKDNPEWSELIQRVAHNLVLQKQVEVTEGDVVVEDNIDPVTGEVLNDE